MVSVCSHRLQSRSPASRSRPRRWLRAVVIAVVSVGLVSLGAVASGATGKHYKPGPVRVYGFPPGWSTSPSTPPIPLSCRPSNFPLPDVPQVCHLGRHYKGAPTIVLWGDSHAWQQVPALEAAIGRRHVNLVATLFGGCPVMDLHLTSTTESDYSSCPQTAAVAVNYITKLVHQHRDVRVVIAEAWQIYHRILQKTPDASKKWTFWASKFAKTNAHLGRRGTPAAFATLGRLHVPTDVVGPMPMAPLNAPTCARSDNPYSCPLPRRLALRSETENNQHIRALMSRLTEPGRLIEPANFLCSATTCRGTFHGHPAYWDLLHISARVTSRYGKQYFDPTVAAVLADSK